MQSIMKKQESRIQGQNQSLRLIQHKLAALESDCGLLEAHEENQSCNTDSSMQTASSEETLEWEVPEQWPFELGKRQKLMPSRLFDRSDLEAMKNYHVPCPHNSKEKDCPTAAPISSFLKRLNNEKNQADK